jgi:GNAT superfamily N-acetyltransferase
MQIVHPTESDWRLFLELARLEGWRVPAQELALYRGPFADAALVLKEAGKAHGFVTAVAHEKSGWVGNLLVPKACRGKGFGALLFEHALRELERRGMRNIWLTASVQGRPIYEKRGFRVLDGVVRWTCRAAEESAAAAEVAPAAVGRLLAADARVWGESRQRLLAPLAAAGTVLASGGTVALLQEGNGMRVIGPWLSPELCPRENRLLLTALLAAAGPGEELVADVLASSPVASLLAAAGFAPAGYNDLMLRGEAAGDLTRLVALASLGSMG